MSGKLCVASGARHVENVENGQEMVTYIPIREDT